MSYRCRCGVDVYEIYNMHISLDMYGICHIEGICHVDLCEIYNMHISLHMYGICHVEGICHIDQYEMYNMHHTVCKYHCTRHVNLHRTTPARKVTLGRTLRDYM